MNNFSPWFITTLKTSINYSLITTFLLLFSFNISHSQIQDAYGFYQDVYEMESDIIQEGVNTLPCVGQRPDFSALPLTQQVELTNIIQDYLTSQLNPNYDSETDHPFLKYAVVAEHTAYGNPIISQAWHSNNELFFSWHRDYLQGLEQYLLDNGFSQFVPLPAWDPSSGLPDFLKNSVVQEVLNTPLTVNTGNGPIDIDMELNSVNPGDLNMYIVDNLTCDQFNDMDDYAGFIRASREANDGIASHNEVHGSMGIGGAMSAPQTASAASVFWLFHAHVDELYHCYQTRCQSCTPSFIRATHGESRCDYCFDFSLNENVDNISVTIIDANGIETIIPWSSSRNCIPFSFMNSGESYTAVITGSNSTNNVNNCNSEDIVTISFIAPNQPRPSKFGNPCLQILTEPHFPIPDDNDDDRNFTIKNQGSKRTFTIINSNLNTGSTINLGTRIIDEGDAYYLTIPRVNLEVGQNVLILHVDGQSMDIDYMIH